MNINVNNCEAFFLDYYEGNLSEGQVAELFAFLKSHPQMREVFESFGDISVNDENGSAPDFSFLKKDVVADEHEQAEVWMVEFIEGQISDENRLSLENYLKLNPAKRKELELLKKTILHPDPAEKLIDFSGLKKPVAVNADNFDDFAIAAIEGTISAGDKSLLDNFIATHPEYAKQFEAYQKTILTSDEGVILDNKSSLKKVVVEINISNIDELLIAKVEGELSASEEQAVEAFIATHPGYKRELSLLQQTKSRPDTAVVFDAKNVLKRGVPVITEENFDEMAIAAAEGLLNSEEKKALDLFVGSNSTRRKTVAAYNSAKVQPDLSVVFADKESLKRKDRGGIIWWSTNIRFAAAAVIILILAVYVFIKFGSATSDQPGNTLANQSNDPEKKQQIIPEEEIKVQPAPENADAYVAVQQQNDNGVHGTHGANPVAVVNNQNVGPEFSYIPTRMAGNSIPNKGDDKVNFSDALYAVVYNAPVNTGKQNDYLSPGQLAMRWMKEKLDGPDADLKRNERLVAETRQTNKQDQNVDGLDLTESAVNRVGIAAANGNVSMDQREDGTWLHLWKYTVRVGRGN